jgi:hypothetical protein
VWSKDNVRRMSLPISTIWPRTIRSKLWMLPGKFFKRTGADRRLFLEAFCQLALARFAILVVPFRRIAPFLGQVSAESPRCIPGSEPLAQRISWAVQTAARYTPWESKCLAQAIAAKMMLKRCHVPSTLYLGMSRDAPAGLSAHAWLRCGERILTGGPVHNQFTVIAHFAEKCP